MFIRVTYFVDTTPNRNAGCIFKPVFGGCVFSFYPKEWMILTSVWSVHYQNTGQNIQQVKEKNKR